MTIRNDVPEDPRTYINVRLATGLSSSNNTTQPLHNQFRLLDSTFLTTYNMFSSRRTVHTSTGRSGGGLSGLVGTARRATAGSRAPRTTAGVGPMAGGRRTGGRGLFSGPRATKAPRSGGGLLSSMRGPRTARPARTGATPIPRTPGGIVTKIKRTLMGGSRTRTTPRTRRTRI